MAAAKKSGKKSKAKKKSPKRQRKNSVTVVLLTLNGISTIEAVIRGLLNQAAQIEQILVVDSSSTDGTVEKIWDVLRAAGKERLLHLIRIPRSEFHHARTRDFALSRCRTRFAALLVQDAIPANASWLEGLLAPFDYSPHIAASCSRILPYSKTHLLAQRDVLADPSASREPRVFTRDDTESKGGRIWYQHVSACVRVSAWKQLSFSAAYEAGLQGKGDFLPGFGEDRIWAKAICGQGRAIAFSPRSVVLHTHDYSLLGVFSRERQDLRLRARQGFPGRKHLLSAVPHVLAGTARDARFLLSVDAERKKRVRALARSIPYRLAQAFGQWLGTREGLR